MRPVFRAVVALTPALCAAASQHAITIDGQFADWSAVAPAYLDPGGDALPGGVDFGTAWLADDDQLLFMRIDVAADLDLSENNDVVLYLDTDDDPATGLAVEGLGAELVWHFGQRQGTAHLPGGPVPVQHDAIRFRGAPTITATAFEIAIGRDALPDGVNGLFQGTTIRAVVVDEFGGDRLPDAGTALTYDLGSGGVAPPSPIALERLEPGDLRLISYNVLNDSPWNPGLTADFGAQIAAVAPDILCFQEIYGHTPQQTADLVSTWLPGTTWHSTGNNDCKTISRYAILDDWALDGNQAVLLDTTAVLDSGLLIINVHLPCCGNDGGRQNEVDRILQFLRVETAPGGGVPQDTPIIFTGDTNFVGLAQQVTSILTGDVVNEATFGPDFAPDWDGTALTNAISRHTAQRMGYTWRNDGSSFWPGHLDYVVYSDSRLQLANDYILFTPAMDTATLDNYGLTAGASLASDHLLVCADFRPLPPIAGCTTLADCADGNLDGIRDDGCVWWACVEGACVGTDVIYADMGGQFGSCPPDRTADANDRFQVLNCFANSGPDGGPYTCEANAPAALNVDTAGQFGSCQPDGVCDGNDAFAALNAFSHITTCACPADGNPAPARRAIPSAVRPRR